jgi:hypothetical protein
MSISTDMSASDELSLDGSESNLIIEAAKESAKKQRAQTETPEHSGVANPSDSDDAPTPIAEHAVMETGIGNRATLQLNAPGEFSEESMDESSESQSDADEADSIADVEADCEAHPDRTDTPELQKPASDEFAVSDDKGSSTDDSASASLDESDAESNEHSEPEQPTSTALLAAENTTSPPPKDQEQASERDDSASSGDGIAYVAFDDGIPEDDGVADLSMQSLDVGVESLSMDDSLYLGELKSEETGDSSSPEEVRDTTESPVLVHPSSVKLRSYGTHNMDELTLELDETGVLLGRESESGALSDPFVSPNHCQINLINGQVQVTDLDSLNGTWIRISEMQDLAHGDQIRLGNQSFTLEHSERDSSSVGLEDDNTRTWSGDTFSTGWYLTASDRLCVPIPDSGVRIGRLTGTLVFEQDSALSSVHAVILPTGQCTKLRDFHTRTGSWLRVDGAVILDMGDEFMLGNTRFRIERS